MPKAHTPSPPGPARHSSQRHEELVLGRAGPRGQEGGAPTPRRQSDCGSEEVARCSPVIPTFHFLQARPQTSWALRIRPPCLGGQAGETPGTGWGGESTGVCLRLPGPGLGHSAGRKLQAKGLSRWAPGRQGGPALGTGRQAEDRDLAGAMLCLSKEAQVPQRGSRAPSVTVKVKVKPGALGWEGSLEELLWAGILPC